MNTMRTHRIVGMFLFCMMVTRRTGWNWDGFLPPGVTALLVSSYRAQPRASRGPRERPQGHKSRGWATTTARRTSSVSTDSDDTVEELRPFLYRPVPKDKQFLIHWKGEINDRYSFHFRHYEFAGALDAVAYKNDGITTTPITSSMSQGVRYENALNYDGDAPMADNSRLYYDESMQYIQGIDNAQHLIDACQRCSLVHAVYQVVAIEDSYRECSDAALANGGFSDMYVGGPKEHDTWCLRVRQYGADVPSDSKGKRHGERARSMQEERKALQDLTPLLSKFGGGVDLTNPDCHVYLFQGLQGKTILASRMASGPQVYAIAPTTRICITNTPLCPIAAFSLCNIAGVRDGLSILDPYAGSCTTLLAAAMMMMTSVPKGMVRMVGIEIAHDGLVNRNDIRRDFESRNFTLPLALLHGDSTDESTRDYARSYIYGEPFDLIITDPPYGIRESSNHIDQDPLSELCDSIARDYMAGKPLLKKGGKLVAFVPCTDEERIEECLPSRSTLAKAGLELLDKIEQPLNDKLSRWLVSFRCNR